MLGGGSSLWREWLLLGCETKLLSLFLWNVCPLGRSGKKSSQWRARIQISLSNAVTKYFIIGRISIFAFAVFANDTVGDQGWSRLNWKPSFAKRIELETKEKEMSIDVEIIFKGMPFHILLSIIWIHRLRERRMAATSKSTTAPSPRFQNPLVIWICRRRSRS